MKRIIYLLAVFVAMTAVWAQESGVSVVDFTKGAGTWQRRVWKNGGKEFDMSALSVRPEDPELKNLLLDPFFKAVMDDSQAAWRRVAVAAIQTGVPMPCITAALSYFDGYRNARLPQNLLQAQRDYFGAHTYERVDKPRGEFFHTNWTGHGGSTTANTYIA